MLEAYEIPQQMKEIYRPEKSDYRFPVALEPAFDSRGNEVPKTKLVVRQDNFKVLSAVSDRYRLIPHERVVEPIKDFVRILGRATAQYSVERDGARLVVTHTFKDIGLELPGHKMPGQAKKGDVVALRTYATNSYNTSTPFEFRFGAMVLRCLNGATAFDSLFGIKHRHIGNSFEDEIIFPKPEILVAAFHQQGDLWKAWAEKGFETRAQVAQIVEQGLKLQLMTRKAYQEKETYFTQADTVWDLYNAFTYVITHNEKIQESGRISRFDRLNALFNQGFGQEAQAS